MKLRKTLAGILGAVVMLLGVGTFEHVNRETGVRADSDYFTKVTDVSKLTDGAKIVITYDDAYALSTTQNNNNRAATSFDINKPLSEQASVQEITLEQSGSNFYFKVGDDQYLYPASGSGNQLKTSKKSTVTSKGLFEIKINSDVTYITSTDTSVRGSLRFNLNQGSPIFNCYKTDASSVANQMPYTTIYLSKGESASDEQVTATKIKEFVNDYYNNGVYTKKSRINLNEEVQDYDLEDIFHFDDKQPIRLDRTTYYTNNALFMANYDGTIGGEGKINSGYRNEGSDLIHFTLDSNKKPVDDWGVSGESITSFFVTLEKMMRDDYFVNEGWSFTSNSTSTNIVYSTGDILDNNDPYLKDFLAFVAPCLEEIVLSEKYSEYFTFVKLTMENEKHDIYGNYLSMKIHISSTNSGQLNVNGLANEEYVLSEARIYKGNNEFDDDLRNVTLSVPSEGGNVTCDVDISKPVKLGTELTFTITVEDNFEIVSFTINELDKLSDLENNKIKWIVEDTVKVEIQFKSTLVSEDIIFELGANGSATHDDGSSKSTYTETVNGYTLNITSGVNMYTGAKDAKGNSCIKLGASSKAGSFQFTVPSDITSVVIYVGKYKANTSKVTINGTNYTLTNSSNNGAYDVIEVDTKTNKTVKVTSASGGYRLMINSIEFVK